MKFLPDCAHAHARLNFHSLIAWRHVQEQTELCLTCNVKCLHVYEHKKTAATYFDFWRKPTHIFPLNYIEANIFPLKKEKKENKNDNKKTEQQQ